MEVIDDVSDSTHKFFPDINCPDIVLKTDPKKPVLF